MLNISEQAVWALSFYFQNNGISVSTDISILLKSLFKPLPPDCPVVTPVNKSRV